MMKTLLRAVSANLRAHSPDLQPIFLWDCFPAHLKGEVLNQARLLNVILILVPAKLTWLVQPLDCCVFQQYKASLRRAYANLRQHAEGVVAKPYMWWFAVIRHVHHFVHSRDWSDTFVRTGWLPPATQASSFCGVSWSGRSCQHCCLVCRPKLVRSTCLHIYMFARSA